MAFKERLFMREGPLSAFSVIPHGEGTIRIHARSTRSRHHAHSLPYLRNERDPVLQSFPDLLCVVLDGVRRTKHERHALVDNGRHLVDAR